MRFSKVANVFSLLESSSGRIEMATSLAELIKSTPVDEVKYLIYLVEGILAPPYIGIEVGMGEHLCINAISDAFGYDTKYVESMFKKHGDLGEVASALCSKKKQHSLFPKELSMMYVINTFVKIAKASGKGSQDMKIKLLVDLLSNATPVESKFIIRFVLGELRLGAREATIIDALSISKFGDKSYRDVIDRAFNITSDLGYVADILIRNPNKLKELTVMPFKPLMPALAERLPSAKEIINRLGKCAAEAKYDGMRLQCHKKGRKIKLYTRKLEDVTHMFPDVVSAVSSLDVESVVCDGEALAYDEKHKRFYSFQETMHRRRKHGIKAAAETLPIFLYVFDIMYINGKDLTNEPYEKRRAYIERILPKGILKVSEMHIVSSADELWALFNDAISRGLEGLVVKDLHAPYTAGKRKFAWIKLKKSYGKSVDTVDAVIVGYYYGKGHRSKFGIGGVLVAVLNPDTAELETVAKVGSGLTEDEMVKLKSKLDSLVLDAPPRQLRVPSTDLVDVWVQPKVIVEVAFDEITISSVHTCCASDGKGYALRFPRILRVRDDKSLRDITTSYEVKEFYLESARK